MAHRHARTVRFGEVDPAGLAFYPRFYEYFHDAFEDFFTFALGLPYAELVGAQRLGFPAVHVETDFRKPLRHGDAIEVLVAVAAIGTRSFTCAYEVLRAGEVCAKARIVTAVVNLRELSRVELPADLRARLEQPRVGSTTS